MVKFCALPGSMPSVLRELVGVTILMSHAVKFETAPVVETWKSGELRKRDFVERNVARAGIHLDEARILLIAAVVGDG